MGNLKTTPEERAAVRAQSSGIRGSGSELAARLADDLDTLAAEVGRLRELSVLAQRIAKGRAKYPNGCTVLSLLDEAGEVVHAINKYEGESRVREELLDVAAVAMRLYLGEIDRGLEMDGLAQKRKAP